MDLQQAFDVGFAAVKTYVDEAMAAIVRRIEAVEERPQPDSDAIILSAVDIASADGARAAERVVREHFAALPTAANGKDADPAVIARMVAEAVGALPKPADGKSVTAEELAPVIEQAVSRAVGALPRAKDGLGLAGALIDRSGSLIVTLSDGSKADLGRVLGKDGTDGDDGESIPGPAGRGIGDLLLDADGHLVVTLTDGTTKNVGRVRGKDGLPGANAKDGRDGKDGKDGKDGFNVGDIVFEQEGEREIVAVFVRDGERHERGRFKFAVPIYRGVLKSGQAYDRGDMVTHDGSLWHANAPTSEKPGDGKSWQLCVRKGQNGKDGVSAPLPVRSTTPFGDK